MKLRIRSIRLKVEQNLTLRLQLEGCLLLVLLLQKFESIHLKGKVLVKHHVICIVTIEYHATIRKVHGLVVDRIGAHGCLDTFALDDRYNNFAWEVAHFLIGLTLGSSVDSRSGSRRGIDSRSGVRCGVDSFTRLWGFQP